MVQGRQAAIRQLTLILYCLRLYLSYGLLRGPAPRMASPTSRSPSKPVQALILSIGLYCIADMDFYLELNYSSIFSECQGIIQKNIKNLGISRKICYTEFRCLEGQV